MADTAKASTADDSIQGVMNVTKEDQTKINRFARLNARLEDVKDEISTKTNELKNYEDAVSEAEMKVLEDAGNDLHLQVGDILINLDPDETQRWLEERMGILKSSVSELETKKEKIAEEMSLLKAHLYSRFGNNIHLESDP